VCPKVSGADAANQVTSARGNGRATTAGREKFLICANLVKRRASRRRFLKILGMPDFQRHELRCSNDVGVIITWDWFREHQSESRGQKRSFLDNTEVSSLSKDNGQDDPEDGLNMWGYMPGHVHYDLTRADGDVSATVFASQLH
jgi:hypothetical protein